MSTSNIAKFYESSLIQVLLERRNIELIFVDEFSFTNRTQALYSWGPKGQQKRIIVLSQSFSFSWMIGISKRHYYGVMASDSTGDSEMFIRFIVAWITSRGSIFHEDDIKMVFVCDNATIHKNIKVQEFISIKGISILTIWPYSPSLNPVEKVILAMRNKITLLRESGR